MITFTVFGTPQTAGSKRAFVIPGKNGAKPRAAIADDNPRSGDWKKDVARAAAVAMDGLELLRGPVRVAFTFYRARPKGHYGKRGLLPSADPFPHTRPDLTKYVRAAEDGLRGIVWDDDARVVDQINRKRYGSPERVEIIVTPLTRQDAPEPATEQTSLLPRPESELPV